MSNLERDDVSAQTDVLSGADADSDLLPESASLVAPDTDTDVDAEPTLKVFELRAARSEDDDEPLYEFIASDATPDRYGDTIRVSGWDLKAYKRNPVVLAYHEATKPIGTAKVWKDADALRAQIRLAEPGTNAEADTMRELLRQKIVRAVSVGFMPKAAPRRREDDEGRFLGYEFMKQELLEISAVSVPANPNALSVAKSFGLDDDTIARMLPSAGESAQPTVDVLAERKRVVRQLILNHFRLRARGLPSEETPQ